MKITHLLQTLTTRSGKLGLIALSLFASSAVADKAAQTTKMVLYASSGSLGAKGVLYTINAATGAVLTTVGSLNDAAGKNYGMTGLRWDPINSILYGATSTTSPTDPNYLVMIDPATALVTPIGPFGNFITDIAIDPHTGIMYAVSGNNGKFYTVNITTGLATQTGNTGLNFQNGGAFAANAQGVLYGVSNFTVYTYDKTTGKATLVGLDLLADFVDSGAFGPTGTFYGIEGGGGIDNTHLRFLVTINLTTGLGVQLGPMLKDLDGLAFVTVTR